MEVHYDESCFNRGGYLNSTLNPEIMAAALVRDFHDAREVWVSRVDWHESGQTVSGFLAHSNSVIVLLERDYNTFRVGPLEQLLDVSWRGEISNGLGFHRIRLVLSTGEVWAALQTENESCPSLVTRWREEIRIRRGGSVQIVCGLFGQTEQSELTHVPVPVRNNMGKVLGDIQDFFSSYEDVSAASMDTVLSALLHWQVSSGDFVEKGQNIGAFGDQIIVAPATGRIWIVAPSHCREAAPGVKQSAFSAGLPSEQWLTDQQKFWDVQSILSQQDLSQRWNVAIVEACDIPDDYRRLLLANTTSQPEGVLIRHPSDAERAAVVWMRYWGWVDAKETGAGTDAGKDVVAKDAIAQVKAHMNPIGRPDLQNLYGVAAAEDKQGLFFSLTGYTTQALEWAEQVNLPLFRFDLQGVPEPVNRAALSALRDKKDEWEGRLEAEADGEVALEDDKDDMTMQD